MNSSKIGISSINGMLIVKDNPSSSDAAAAAAGHRSACKLPLTCFFQSFLSIFFGP
ncbi:MAG: hypothetical protein ABJA78_02260 [Ferruginibacter sp.]